MALAARLALVVAVLSSLCIGAPLSAQDTGGSFGGGDWGDEGGGGDGDWGGGGSGGGSDDWGSQRDDTERRRPEREERYDYARDEGPREHGAPDSGRREDRGRRRLGGRTLGPWPWIAFGVFCFGLVLGPFSLELVRGWADRHYARRERATPEERAWEAVDVAAVRLAIDWRARRYVQDELMQLAKRGQTGTAQGRARLLGLTAAALRTVLMSWLYAGASNHSPMSPSEAREAFLHHANDARSRFRAEVVRAHDGSAHALEAGPHRAKEHEGPGVVVVTVVVAARRELRDVSARDVPALDALLVQLAELRAHELVALEAIWSPAAEDDRMSTAELEARYPELVRLAPSAIAGRVFCGYCGGPHAAELALCPHCGAPRGDGLADPDILARR